MSMLGAESIVLVICDQNTVLKFCFSHSTSMYLLIVCSFFRPLSLQNCKPHRRTYYVTRSFVFALVAVRQHYLKVIHRLLLSICFHSQYMSKFHFHGFCQFTYRQFLNQILQLPLPHGNFLIYLITSIRYLIILCSFHLRSAVRAKVVV